jgi:hypothetical protein
MLLVQQLAVLGILLAHAAHINRAQCPPPPLLLLLLLLSLLLLSLLLLLRNKCC